MTDQLPDAVDVAIVGAGMAGLCAAWELTRAGLQVAVLEAAAHPGGRVSTERVDGFRLDRGFQLINPSYPQLQRLDRAGALDLDRLQLQRFDAGVRVALAGRHAVLADPRRSPRDLLSSLRAPGSPAEKATFAAWALRSAALKPARLLQTPDEPWGAALDRLGIDGGLRTAVLDPFLAGVLGEDRGTSSAHFVALLIKAFVRGTPGVPAWGMQALPEQLAEALPAGSLHTGVRVESVTGTTVHSSHGTITARAVLIAADPAAAARLGGLDRPELNALTTFWYAAERSPCARPILHVDGLGRGPVVNTAVLSAAAPAYSPDGRALIAATVVGAADRPEDERAARLHAGQIYGVAADDWSLLRTDVLAAALPAVRPPLVLRQPVRLGASLFIAGDHRDTASLQGALASGARAAAEIAAQVRAGRSGS